MDTLATFSDHATLPAERRARLFAPVTMLTGSAFNGAASQAGAKVIAGDFNGDGFTDLAATGVSWWNTIPIAFSRGDGTFTFSNLPSTFNQFSSQAGAKVVSGGW